MKNCVIKNRECIHSSIENHLISLVKEVLKSKKSSSTAEFFVGLPSLSVLQKRLVEVIDCRDPFDAHVPGAHIQDLVGTHFFDDSPDHLGGAQDRPCNVALSAGRTRVAGLPDGDDVTALLATLSRVGVELDRADGDAACAWRDHAGAPGD